MATLHRPTNASQFSSAELPGIIDHTAILIRIDRKKALHNKGECYGKSYEQTYLYTRKWLASVFQRSHEIYTALALGCSQVVDKINYLEGY